MKEQDLTVSINMMLDKNKLISYQSKNILLKMQHILFPLRNTRVYF